MFSGERVDIDGIITGKLKALGLKNKRIVLSKNSKITPLAWDYIRQNNIEVHYEEDCKMLIGKVVDNIWATRKDEKLKGLKLMVVGVEAEGNKRL